MIALPVLAGCYADIYRAPVCGAPVTGQELRALVAGGIPAEMIRERIATHGAEPLSAEARADLEKAGVSKDLLDAMKRGVEARGRRHWGRHESRWVWGGLEVTHYHSPEVVCDRFWDGR